MKICFLGNRGYKHKVMKKFWRSILGNENGSVVVLVAVAMSALLGMTAMSVDVGVAYLKTGQLQTALDAAAYSAGSLLPVSVSDTDAQNAIKDSAIAYAALNGYDNLTRDNVTLENIVLDHYTQIDISASESVSLEFAPVIGINTVSFTRSAAAKLSPVERADGIAPLGVTETELTTRIANNDLTHIVLKYGKSGGIQSSFGALDLNGQGGGASDYRLWITNGYAGEICTGDILLEEFGNMAGPTYAGFTSRYDGCTHYDAPIGGEGCTAEHYDPYCSRIVKVVVYTSQGNGTVKVAGFAAFLLEAQTKDGYITGTFLQMVADGQCSGDSLTDTTFYGLTGLMLIE